MKSKDIGPNVTHHERFINTTTVPWPQKEINFGLGGGDAGGRFKNVFVEEVEVKLGPEKQEEFLLTDIGVGEKEAKTGVGGGREDAGDKIRRDQSGVGHG